MITLPHISDRPGCVHSGDIQTSFGAMFGRLPDGVVLLDPLAIADRWPIVDCNEAFAQLIGRERTALVGCPIDALTWWSEASPHQAGELAWLQRQGGQRYEFTIVNDEQQTRAIEMTLAPVLFAGHQYIVGVCRDISAWRAGERELARRIRLARASAMVATQLSSVAPECLDAAIAEALASVGACLEADRVYAGMRISGDCTFSRDYQWSAARLEATQSADGAQRLREWAQSMVADGADYRSLASESAPVERAYVGSNSCQVAIAVPVAGADMVAGVVACTSSQPDRRWTDAEIRLLASLGECLKRALRQAAAIASLQDNNTRYQLLTNHATDVISVHDAQGVCQYCSPTVRAILGYQPEELIGRTPFDLIHPEDLGSALAKGKVHDSGAITTIYRLRHRDGHYIWAETSARVVSDPATGAMREVVVITRDVDARKRLDAQIERLAYFDPLTGLANRRRFHEQTQQALERAERTLGCTALLYLDLDGFKKVNDTLGHDAGDELLVQVAMRLRQQLRNHDTLARLGGDEFAVVLPSYGTEATITLIADKLVDQIREPFTIRGQSIHLDVSIGIACAPQDGRSVEDLLKHADIAMYRAKTEGDGFQFFDPALSSYSQERLQLEADLRHALAAHQLFVEYQPILDIQRNCLVSFEALVRWQHPLRGRLMPDQFVPLAEECGLIPALDRVVLIHTLHQVQAWLREGIDVSVAVNISALTLHDAGFPEFVRTCLHETGVGAQYLIVEMTESAAMRNIDRTCGVLREIRDAGVRVALDDFGSGQTALKHLKELPIDYVKIDRAFTEGIGSDSRDEGVVRAIVALSEGLGVPVVAEGISNVAQLLWLRQIGCTMAQGFAIGRPCAPNEVGRAALQGCGALG
jgi:diguanylate cyclase (GGDEF)-like protein/PAS domain S-box-containing protein